MQYIKIWDAVEAVFRGKCMVLPFYNGKKKRSRITNLNFHFRQLEKKQIIFKVSRRKAIITANNDCK